MVYIDNREIRVSLGSLDACRGVSVPGEQASMLRIYDPEEGMWIYPRVNHIELSDEGVEMLGCIATVLPTIPDSAAMRMLLNEGSTE